MKALGLDVEDYDGELPNDGEEYGIEDDGEDLEDDLNEDQYGEESEEE